MDAWQMRVIAKRLLLELPRVNAREALAIFGIAVDEVRNDPILFPEEHVLFPEEYEVDSKDHASDGG